jgi:ATP-dependent Clp protease ATP-binding subunit ClpA
VTREQAGTSWWPALAMARVHAAAAGARSVGTQHVLLALLATEGEAAAVLGKAGVNRADVLATLQGITGVGARTEPVALERVAVSPRVAALIRRASRGLPGRIPDLAVLGELLDDGGEPSLVQLILTSLGAQRRAVHAYLRAGIIAPVRSGDAEGDLVAG